MFLAATTISLDLITILTSLGTGVAVIGFVYTFLRNFKDDINKHIDKLDNRITSMEERMFWMATGKKLEDAILEERLKNPKTDP